jgi:hypothetical protein
MSRDGMQGTFEAYWGTALQNGATAQAARTTNLPKPSDPARPLYGPDAPSPNGSQPIPIPPVMHFCGQHCVTFVKENDNQLANYTNLPGQYNIRRIFTIEKFTPDQVVIRRKDTGSHPGEAVYTATMNPGYSSVTGQGWAISWGADLDKLPGSDEELAIARGQQSPQASQAEQNMSMLQLLLGLFSSGADSSGEPKPKVPTYGCAAGYSGCHHYAEP